MTDIGIAIDSKVLQMLKVECWRIGGATNLPKMARLSILWLTPKGPSTRSFLIANFIGRELNHCLQKRWLQSSWREIFEDGEFRGSNDTDG